jgi:hypothetical protein
MELRKTNVPPYVNLNGVRSLSTVPCATFKLSKTTERFLSN